jgi:hypothetical protein
MDLAPLSIDWSPLGRAGMDSARIAGFSSGEMDVIVPAAAASAGSGSATPPTTPRRYGRATHEEVRLAITDTAMTTTRKRTIGTFAEIHGREVTPPSASDQPSASAPLMGMEGLIVRKRQV